MKKKLGLLCAVLLVVLTNIPTNLLSENLTPNTVDIITNVEMNHSNGETTVDNSHWENWETIHLTYNFDFGYPSKIKSGDTYNITLPDAFRTFSSTPVDNYIYVIDENGEYVKLAKVTVYPNNTIILDFSEDNGYIDLHDDISGQFSLNVKFAETYEGEVIEFEGSADIEIGYTPVKPSTPQVPSPEQNNLLKASKLVDFDSRTMRWTLKISFSEDVENAYIIDEMQDGVHAFKRYYEGIDPDLVDYTTHLPTLKWEKAPNWTTQDWSRDIVRVRYHEPRLDGNGELMYDNTGKVMITEIYEFVEIEPVAVNEDGKVTSFRVPLGDVKNNIGHDNDIQVDYYTEAIDLAVEKYYNGATFRADGLQFHQTGVVDTFTFSGGATGTIRQLSFQKTDMNGVLIPTNNAKFSVERLADNGDIIRTQNFQLKDGIAHLSLSKGNYRITEIEAPKGYEILTSSLDFVVDDNSSSIITLPTVLSFANKKALMTELTVNKKWQDSQLHDQDDEYIEIELYQNSATNSELYLKKKIFQKDGWSYTFENLPVTNTLGEDVTYSVKEVNILSGYLVNIIEKPEDNLIEIVNIGEETEVTVTKSWADNDNQDGIRPDKIIVQLYAQNQEVGTPIELNEVNTWNYTWSNLPMYENAERITYSVKEVDVPEGYSLTVEHDATTRNTVIDLQNTHIPEVISISGNKSWMDDQNEKGKRPSSIIIELYADGAKIEILKVTEAMDWKYEFTQLPKYKDGQLIMYHVAEIPVSGYTTEIQQFDIINTSIPEEVVNERTDQLPKTGETSPMLLGVFLVIAGLFLGGKYVKEYYKKGGQF